MIPIKPIPAGDSQSSHFQQAAATGAAFLKPGQINLQALPPLSLYIHYPWCVRKCPYCDFNSHEKRGDFSDELYMQAVIHDLELALPLIWGRKVHSIFFGGGTPSLLDPLVLDRFMSQLRALISIDSDVEITMEANPGTAEAEKFHAFKASGINRLSLGIQSFNDAHLRELGRIHSAQQARHAIELAAKNFDNFNLDLMFALPGQTLVGLDREINELLEFNPPHISLYHLTLEPNTVFAKYPPSLPDEDLAAEMQDLIFDRLRVKGFDHYEVSAYAQPNRKAKHNLNYWNFGDYLGIGAGAHSKLSFPHHIIRQQRPSGPQSYMDATQKGVPVIHQKEIGYDELGFEFMLNTLRLQDGFPVNLFQERTGLPINVIENPLLLAEEKGLIHRDHLRIVPTEMGKKYLNNLQELFL